MIIKNTILLIILAVLTSFTTGVANAALVSHTSSLTGSSFDPWPDPIDPDSLDSNGSIGLGQFDPAMGTLNSIFIELSSVFTYVTQFENKSTSSGSTVTKWLQQQLKIGDLLDTGIVNYQKTWDVGAYDGAVDYAGTSGFSVTENSGGTFITRTLSGADDLTAYIGTGDLNLGVYSNATFSGGFTGGNGSFLNQQSFVTSATVTYDYSPVPIPGAVWLLGSCIFGFAGYRRIKK